MLKRFKKIFFLSSLAVFSFFTVNYYFSEKNIVHINKSRSSHSVNLYSELPLLKNDTENILVYKNDLEEFNNKRKKRIWENLISND